ncbi:ImuA family protein, partial [Gluconobacter sp.]|uniref:ImuA family protein n=1 Tax=Gluconobacter sp. TaxID=1876758 RepID=UPI0039EA9AE3
LQPVDDHLGGGFKTASLHDILVPDPLEIGASLALLLPLLARSNQPVFWLGAVPPQLHAWGLHQAVISLRHLICVESDDASVLAVAEDILRGPERAIVVIAGLHIPSLTEVRRLNLAAESSGNTGFFLRPVSVSRSSGKDPCACATRWQITSHPSDPLCLPGLVLPLPGPCRLSVSLLRVRGGRPAHWLLDCPDHAPHSRPLASLLAHRAPPALPVGSLPFRSPACRARA